MLSRLIAALLARPMALCLLRLMILNGRKPNGLPSFSPRRDKRSVPHDAKLNLAGVTVKLAFDGDSTFTITPAGATAPPITFIPAKLGYPDALSSAAGALALARQARARNIDLLLLACVSAHTLQSMQVSKSNLTFSSSSLDSLLSLASPAAHGAILTTFIPAACAHFKLAPAQAEAALQAALSVTIDGEPRASGASFNGASDLGAADLDAALAAFAELDAPADEPAAEPAAEPADEPAPKRKRRAARS